MKQVYYRDLVDWDEIDSHLVSLPEDAQGEAEELIKEILDHTVLHRVLELLPEERHEEFLEICAIRYHDPEILIWLEQHIGSIHIELKLTLHVTKGKVQRMLQEP